MLKLNKNLNFSYKKPPLIIAEISGNHNGNKKRFLNLVESACKCNADLIKIQTYEPDDITLKIRNNFFKIKKGIWKGKYLYDLYKTACTPYSWHKEAFNIAKKYNKIIFSSPFSQKGVDFLENLNVPLYKLASFEITDFRLIDYIASKKKPIIISTGMASLNEIEKAIEIIKKYHKKIIILHCVSNYPTEIQDSDLKRIVYLKKKFKNYKIGLSDHTSDIFTSIASIPLKICMIEKHFNMDEVKTPDSSFSINPKMLKDLKEISSKIFYSLNKNSKKIDFNANIKLRRSIFAKEKIKKNQKLTLSNTVSLRPCIGIGADKIFRVIGKKVNKEIKKNSPIYIKDLK
ncbi:pseudaminic acid synthase [Candidatus Pelagibacter sp.]|uniref:pseudaminic acid synthase n=1 Tax=Candidatus Pelagibacter sp. TaxID=2024849 RepID=UPI003F8745A6